METVRTVLEKRLQNVREAPPQPLGKSEVRACEARDREGYSKEPQTHRESHLWEAEAEWPAI